MKISKGTLNYKILFKLQCVFSVFSLDYHVNHSTITRVSDYNVYESCDPSCQLMKCHAVTTLHLTRLQLQYQNHHNSKVCLLN